MNLYKTFKEMVLLCVPESSCPHYWGFKIEKCLREHKRRISKVCKECWEKAIREAELEEENRQV